MFFSSKDSKGFLFVFVCLVFLKCHFSGIQNIQEVFFQGGIVSRGYSFLETFFHWAFFLGLFLDLGICFSKSHTISITYIKDKRT